MKRIAVAVSTILLFSALAQEASGFGKNKITYDEFDWKIYTSTHFDVYFYEEERESLQKIVNYAESAYDELSRRFDHQIEKRIPLIFYATHSAFEQNNIILNFIPEGVGAFAEPVRNRMVLPIDMPDEAVYALMKHELTHIFEYEIFFQGRMGRRIRANPPTWLMEGLASYMAQDEDTADRMVLRDAVVNDRLPSISQPVGGFFGYRFGHAVFEFMETNWGIEGLRDFIYEYRNALGSDVERPIRRAFDLSINEFDSLLRTWLRKRYLPALISKGEPLEYGEPFRLGENVYSQETSPVPAPSGDLMAAIATYKQDVDVALFTVPDRKLFKNISRGFPDHYEYVIAQFLTTAPAMGRDIGFSPDGDRIAMFVKKERGRQLMIVNALYGNIERIIPMPDVEQQLSPSWSPDGSRIVFHGFSGNRADIFEYDFRADTVRNLTDDAHYDAAPVYSPDGESVIYSSVMDQYAKLVRIDLRNTSDRYVLTTGDWNDRDAWFSPDGGRIFYASDRPTARDKAVLESELLEIAATWAGDDAAAPKPDAASFSAFNIYSLDLSTGEVLQYTDVIGGSFTPVVFEGEDSEEKFVFASYYKGAWTLFVGNTADHIGVAENIDIPVDPMIEEDRPQFLAPVEVNLDPDQEEDEGRFRLFIEDVQVNAGVTSDQTFVSRSVLYMSDMLGGRRFIAAFDSVSTFSNFDFIYLDMRRRWNWGARIFDDRTYYLQDQLVEDVRREREELYRETGALGFISYPFDRYRRLDLGIGYLFREITLPTFVAEQLGTSSFEDDFPYVSATLTGDSAVFRSFGPISGRRYDLTLQHQTDLDQGGALSNNVILDFRQYFQMTARTLLAARVFAGYSEGSRPGFYYFGGLNTLRGYRFRSIVGNRAFYGNFEVRFPLVDVIATPVMTFREIRGSLFFDIGAAWFNGQDYTFYEDGALQDGLASVGYGISLNLFGLQLNWDFAKRTDLDSFDGDLETSFWIGPTF